uniref:NADH dehydrogenase [ubiquinone] 1 alpha subcomplex subunit 3 n=1 Tax=Gopherus evgoodei TaxID=1825980 RepID=A0A8C4WQB8_9SAUR
IAALSKIGAFLKNAWAKEPVITVSFAIGILAAVTPLLSPYAKYSGLVNRATPYVYPGAFPQAGSARCPLLATGRLVLSASPPWM